MALIRKLIKFIFICSILAAIGWLGFHQVLPLFQANNFPSLPVGAYQGTITGLSDGDTATSSATTFYVEREPISNLLTVVVLATGWQPRQMPIPGARAAVLVQNTNMDEIPWDPLILTNARISYTFTGTKSGNSFKGRFVADDGSEGDWQLEEAPHLSNISLPKSATLVNWLDTKQEYVALARELKAVTLFKESVKQQQGLVDDILNNPTKLKARAEKIKSETDNTATKLSDQNKKLNKEIGDLVSELGLIGRVSNTGKTVELARRVAKREARWYLANWDDESSRGLEERLADELSIDPASLSSALKRAEEIYRLRLEISKESERIQSLKALADPSNNNNLPADEQRKQERRGIWQRLFG